jgi:hypothetical protein
MGTQIVCDECGVSIANLDRVHVSRDSIPEGSLRMDLCPTCADPITKAPVVAKRVKAQKEKIERNAKQMMTPPPSEVVNAQ